MLWRLHFNKIDACCCGHRFETRLEPVSKAISAITPNFNALKCSERRNMVELVEVVKMGRKLVVQVLKVSASISGCNKGI